MWSPEGLKPMPWSPLLLPWCLDLGVWCVWGSVGGHLNGWMAWKMDGWWMAWWRFMCIYIYMVYIYMNCVCFYISIFAYIFLNIQMYAHISMHIHTHTYLKISTFFWRRRSHYDEHSFRWMAQPPTGDLLLFRRFLITQTRRLQLYKTIWAMKKNLVGWVM